MMSKFGAASPPLWSGHLHSRIKWIKVPLLKKQDFSIMVKLQPSFRLHQFGPFFLQLPTFHFQITVRLAVIFSHHSPEQSSLLFLLVRWRWCNNSNCGAVNLCNCFEAPDDKCNGYVIFSLPHDTVWTKFVFCPSSSCVVSSHFLVFITQIQYEQAPFLLGEINCWGQFAISKSPHQHFMKGKAIAINLWELRRKLQRRSFPNG